MSYELQISSLESPSFDAIRNVAVQQLHSFYSDIKDELYRQLNRGIALLETHEQMCKYLDAFGKMHKAKLLHAFDKLPLSLFEDDIEVIDWGCGQGIGSIVLFDYLKDRGIKNNIKRITLIEPASKTLERARLHLQPYTKGKLVVNSIGKFFHDIDQHEIQTEPGRTLIHIFSNILDVAEIDLKKLAGLVDSSVRSESYLVCVGPLNPGNNRLDAFFNYFNPDKIGDLYQYQERDFKGKWTYKARIYKLEPDELGHLIPIEYYPTVQFHAAYELDFINQLRTSDNPSSLEEMTFFEVAAPFDLGASVYEDIHPILAVMNNMICRGLPTKSSLFIEESFCEAFGNTQRKVNLGEIYYPSARNESIDFSVHKNYLDNADHIDTSHKEDLQFLLTPIAIARFQKVLLEAIITGHLDIRKDKWQILVEEKDVPFAHLAIKDFTSTFNNLIELSQNYRDFKLPEIDLYVVSNLNFGDSKLHAGRVFLEVTTNLKTKVFDMVVTQGMLTSANAEIENFSVYQARNLCYFNIRSANRRRTQRAIYTSDLIKYRNLVVKNSQGVYEEVTETKELLTYFLRLLFRKEQFRVGQLPILDRALQNLPVIGLLPTGGGKSLTYQISALLQPGVTLIVDPLKSLMKDQYEGLLRNGIDTATYINSSLPSTERRRREELLQSSQLQFIFLSPERLSIASFREKLRNMHEYNVYFSYGVIDEVHCVSEWGHDFRFSYLHLGRNLYSFVKSKNKEISLFGLTATASFDVLADVERELSGNGAFALDADAIVRYEHTNRLELQYKIERVPVEFGLDEFYDPNKLMAPHLPKAVNITNSKKILSSKAKFLRTYIKRLPDLLNHIQSKDNVTFIKQRYIERQRNEEGTESPLVLNIENQFFTQKETYDNAGIVFCSHVDNTGVSVRVNKENLVNEGVVDITSFTGQDDDVLSAQNLDTFRNNKSPLMVATKAFGMGIDKPNVRYTVNMNYSNSLESFIQEAGRAGRDKNIALSTILVSDYALVQISRACPIAVSPIGIIRNKWFKKNDLEEILTYYKLSVPDEYLIYATPSNDIVKLHCTKDNSMFSRHLCDVSCSEYRFCQLKNVTKETKGWKSEFDLIQELKTQNIHVTKKNFQYLNPDYQVLMYFFNESFKGENIEKRYLHHLLDVADLIIELHRKEVHTTGFLSTIREAEFGDNVIVKVPYDEDNYNDLSKAIYRMTCIELIVDFTQDYANKKFRIVANKKQPGGYYDGLCNFLKRYYTAERADAEVTKVKLIRLNKTDINPFDGEIYRCLAYLTDFVYEKISEKRKRAIDDMRLFCLEGLSDGLSWIETNENLKDFIYYYFNSKFAKNDYKTDLGISYSLVSDTKGGKLSNLSILYKYLKVTDDEVVGLGTPLDNVKHLYGAVRLISRSLTDSNPTLSLLEAYCLVYMGIGDSENLENQFSQKYTEGMIEFSQRPDECDSIDDLLEEYNRRLAPLLPEEKLTQITEEVTFMVHLTVFNNIRNKYIRNDG